ncbi:MAG TPA: hypothetical protein PLS90_09560 [Candidatus Sumerlaeota bacterium]|nr:hypothetical protein [Candidatus Sumerlaeota bacterium]HOR26643.1 hypothetical protein [Candidatus Sumerlaeota bacterium]HPK02690.1 hypothetical protein [Candidatus Sumerlaeota bacterium]
MTLACLLPLSALGGCQARFPAERIPKMKWLILPFEQPPSMSTTPRAIRGWWFGARTVRQNPRAGQMIADSLNRAMAEYDFINLYSAIDLRYYFADKRQILEDTYPHLSEGEIQDLLGQVDPLDYGKELGADKILTGRIIRQYLAENRTIHWWWSVAEIEAQVIDVQTGRVEWSERYDVRTQLASQSAVIDDVVARMLEDLKEDYFLPLSRR